MEQVLTSFRKLSDVVEPEWIGWRYDPIVLSPRYTPEFHRNAFAQMAEFLSGYIHPCVINLIDLYPKVQRNFPELCLLLGKIGWHWEST